MTDEKTYEIPDWMEPFLPALGSREGVQELMGGAVASLRGNPALAVIQVETAAQLALLTRLHEFGMLLAPGTDEWVFRPRWVCDVARSGFHNGANCTPGDPHGGWNCTYRYELSVEANKTTMQILRAHGFNAVDPPKKKGEEYPPDDPRRGRQCGCGFYGDHDETH